MRRLKDNRILGKSAFFYLRLLAFLTVLSLILFFMSSCDFKFPDYEKMEKDLAKCQTDLSFCEDVKDNLWKKLLEKEKKCVEKRLNKNQIKDCEAREKNKCNDERIVCNLKDKKEYKKCEYEYNACVEVAYSNCEKKYHELF